MHSPAQRRNLLAASMAGGKKELPRREDNAIHSRSYTAFDHTPLGRGASGFGLLLTADLADNS
jgi:hypothetical protein